MSDVNDPMTAPDPGTGQAGGSPSDLGTPSGEEAHVDAHGNDQVLELRRKVTSQGEELKQLAELNSTYSQVMDEFRANPGWTLNDVIAKANGTPPDASRQAQDEMQTLFEKFDPATREPLQRLIELAQESARATVMSEVAPQLSQVRRIGRETAHDRALRESGVDPTSADYRAFVGSDLQTDAIYKTLSSADPRQAAVYAAQRFTAGRPNGPTSGDPRIARESTLESGGSRGARASGARDVVKMRPGTDIHAMLAAIKAGKSVETQREPWQS